MFILGPQSKPSKQGGFLFIAPKASAEGACIFSKLVTMERVMGYYGTCMMGYDGVCIMGYYGTSMQVTMIVHERLLWSMCWVTVEGV